MRENSLPIQDQPRGPSSFSRFLLAILVRQHLRQHTIQGEQSPATAPGT